MHATVSAVKLLYDPQPLEIDVPSLQKLPVHSLILADYRVGPLTEQFSVKKKIYLIILPRPKLVFCYHMEIYFIDN